MLVLDHITKRFGKIIAVDNLSLRVKPGEIVGLIGPNGSGKTTTIKMIAGLYQPTEGSISLQNHQVSALADETRALIGYIPDEPAVYEKLTGEELLHFVGEAFNIAPKERQTKINKLLKEFPMPDQTQGFFEDYSRGTRQKFMIMAALIHNPPLLLIDEPIVGLDPASTDKAIEIFSKYVADKQHAILLCTHTLPVAERLCHRFIILDRGQVLAQGTLPELRKTAKNQRSLTDIYLALTSERNND